MKILLIFNLFLGLCYSYVINERYLIYNDQKLYYDYIFTNEGLFFKIYNFYNWTLKQILDYFYEKRIINGNFIPVNDCSFLNKRFNFYGFLFYGFIYKDFYYYFISKDLINKYLFCKLNNQKNLFTWVIRTTYKDYRYQNIIKALNQIPRYFKKGEILDIYYHIFKEKSYQIGYALVYSGNEVILEEIAGGGVCGVATLYYQVFSRLKGFEILERYPHLVFYYEYYNYPGLDATIYGNGKIAYKNLKIKNNFGDVYIEPFYRTDYRNFNYGLRIYSTKSLDILNISTHFKGNCIFTKFYDYFENVKEVKSCYKEIK